MKQKHGAIFGVFLVSAFSARIAIESVKVSQAAYHESILSAGQWLSLPFLLTGVVLLIMAYRKPS
jgi:phosphatidylglycerol:prolipoprotein diacylglycerol transferase